MGDYKLEADLTGAHSPDPQHRGPGEAVHEFGEFIRRLAERGHTVRSAKVTHWPGTDAEHVEHLHGGEAEPAAEPSRLDPVAASEPGAGDAAAAHDGPPADETAAHAPVEG